MELGRTSDAEGGKAWSAEGAALWLLEAAAEAVGTELAAPCFEAVVRKKA